MKGPSSLMSQIRGKCFMDYLTDRERSKAEKWQRHRQDLAEHKPIRAFRFEVFFNGQSRWLSINADAYYDDHSQFLGYRGTVNDITSPAGRAQSGAKTRQMRAGAANQAKSRFLAGDEPRDRTPMQAILGMLELLDQSELTSKQRELIRHVTHSAALLQTLLHDVLDCRVFESERDDAGIDPFAQEVTSSSTR